MYCNFYCRGKGIKKTKQRIVVFYENILVLLYRKALTNKNMKLAILTSRYPQKKEPYNHMFVHVRAKYFVEQGVDVTVFVPSGDRGEEMYEGIKVVRMASREIVKLLKAYDLLYLHLLNMYPTKSGGAQLYTFILREKPKTAIFLHGSDVLTYPEYFFDFSWTLKGVAKYAYTNFWKKKFMAKFLKGIVAHDNKNLILTPSVWLSEQVQTIYHIAKETIRQVPNGIDINLFDGESGYDKRHRILCVRPLTNTYPVEDCIRLMLFLPPTFTLDIYGKGEKKDTFLKLIATYGLQSRVKIKETFFDREELGKLFQEYGIFNAYSKIDTQGVSMCEAMASRRLVISSNKTAIPEFIEDGVSGLLDNDLQSLASRIVDVCNNEEVFNQLTDNARKAMEQISTEKVGLKELEMLKSIL